MKGKAIENASSSRQLARKVIKRIVSKRMKPRMVTRSQQHQQQQQQPPEKEQTETRCVAYHKTATKSLVFCKRPTHYLLCTEKSHPHFAYSLLHTYKSHPYSASNSQYVQICENKQSHWVTDYTCDEVCNYLCTVKPQYYNISRIYNFHRNSNCNRNSHTENGWNTVYSQI
jgi:hypothetical protein